MWMDLIDIAINDGLEIALNHDLDENIAAHTGPIRGGNIMILTPKANDFPIVEDGGELEGGNGLEWGDAGEVIIVKWFQGQITPTQN